MSAPNLYDFKFTPWRQRGANEQLTKSADSAWRKMRSRNSRAHKDRLESTTWGGTLYERPRVLLGVDPFGNGVPNAWRDELFKLMEQCDELDWLVVAKRPENMLRIVPSVWVKSFVGMYGDQVRFVDPPWWPPHIWMLATVEDQEHADKRIPELLQIPVKVRGLSMEPLLGKVDLRFPVDGLGNAPDVAALANIHWVIVGGGSRPMHPDWVRALRDQCADAGVPFWFDGWGEWAPCDIIPGGDIGGDMRKGSVCIAKANGDTNGRFERGDVLMRKVGKKNSGRLLDGREWNEVPNGR